LFFDLGDTAKVVNLKTKKNTPIKGCFFINNYKTFTKYYMSNIDVIQLKWHLRIKNSLPFCFAPIN
tara:strand:+ start:751 stop:948 length:198 start_codon:yes stop_codon:yes gene_type:complete